MNPAVDLTTRLGFLMRVVRRERRHLAVTDERLFAEPFTAERAERLSDDVEQAERTEAFVGRFCRLQDTLGDKLLRAYLEALGERPGPTLDLLDRAEQLRLIPAADEWLTMRKLSNQMIHEYIEDAEVLASALRAGHEFVPTLLSVAHALDTDIQQRGWLDELPD